MQPHPMQPQQPQQQSVKADDGRQQQQFYEQPPPPLEQQHTYIQQLQRQKQLPEQSNESPAEPVATEAAAKEGGAKKDDEQVATAFAATAPVETTVLAPPTVDPTSVETTGPVSATNVRIFPLEEVLLDIQAFKHQHGSADMPISHPSFGHVLDNLIANDIEDELNKKWESQFEALKAYKDVYNDCDIPLSHPTLGDWVTRQRQLYAEGRNDPQSKSRFAKLKKIGFEWEPTKWDRRLEELAEYKRIHGHTDVNIKEEGGLGVWVLNQKFNVKDMPKERVAALDALDFIWNHNRKKRNDTAWLTRYQELVDFREKTGHTNAPTTGGYSKLSKWVAKQREEYRKFGKKESSQLSRMRIDKLNEIGFQWSIQQRAVVPWDERFEVRSSVHLRVSLVPSSND